MIILLVGAFLVAAEISPITPSLNLNGQNRFTISNYTSLGTQDLVMNNSGFYNGNTQVVVKSNDIVFCKGTSTSDDKRAIQECNYRCLSTDSECSAKLQTAVNQNKTIIVREGNYNLTSDIILHSGVKIIGDGNVVFQVGNDFNFQVDNAADLNNFEFKNIHLNATLPHTNRGFSNNNALFNLTGLNSISNFNFYNIKTSNLNGTTVNINIKAAPYGISKNINFEKLDFDETRDAIVVKSTNELADTFQNVRLSNVYFINNATYDSYLGITKPSGNIIQIVGVTGFSFRDVYVESKAADGPAIVILRGHNGDIENIMTNRQYDYAVSLTDENKNINIKNIWTSNPVNYGPLYLHTIDYLIPQVIENINAENLHCLNCTGYASGGATDVLFAPPIWIDNDDSHDDGLDIIRGISIKNFYIEGAGSYGAIVFDATNGTIEDVNIEDGIIFNTSYTGIRIASSATKNINNIVIKDVHFKDLGTVPAGTGDGGDDYLRAAIYLSNARISNLKFINNEYENSSGTMLYRFTNYLWDTNRFAEYTSEGERLIGGISDNRDGRNNETFFIDNYVYTTGNQSIASQNCKAKGIHDGRTIRNSTTSALCFNGNWIYKRVDGNTTWNTIDSFPVACPAGSYLTQLGSSVICSSLGNVTVQNINKSGIMFPNSNGSSSDNLLLYYPFNNNIIDYAGNANSNGKNAVQVGTYTSHSGKFGNALDVNASNYIIVPEANNGGAINISRLTAFSFEYWGYNYGNAGCVAGSGWLGQRNFNTLSNVGNAFTFRIWNQTTSSTATSTAVSVANTWQHVAGTYDGSTIRLYINGVADGSASLTGYMNDTTGNITIGACSANNNFNGTLDEVKFFNRTLTPDEIKSDYERNIEFISKDAYYIKQSCLWEGNTTLGMICSNNRILRGINTTSQQGYCC